MEKKRHDDFGILYDRYAEKVYHKCISFVKDVDLAQDLAHDVFLKTFLNLAKFEGKSKFSTWLYSLTYNFCIDYLRKNNKNMIYTAANSIGVSGSKAIANIVYYLLFIFIAITALNQAGVDTDIITSNITLILGSILLAFAISYGFASRNLVSNMLSSYYGKGKFTEGQRIRIGDEEGVIVRIDSISVTLQQEKQQLVFPSKRLVEEEVIILSGGKDQEEE